MKSRLLTWGVALAVMAGVVACNKSMEFDDEAKAIENEQAIEKYLADSTITATKDSTGMYYVIRKANPTGAKAKAEESVTLKFNAYTLDNKLVWTSTNTDNIPYIRPVGLGFFLVGVERAISLMRVGESATLFMPFYLAFGSYGYEGIPAYSAIKINIEIVASRSEVKQIDDFVASKQLTVTERTAENLVIAKTTTTTGDTLGIGKNVTVKYKGKFLTGVVFDDGNNPYPFTTGDPRTIKGFDQAVRKMRKGEKAVIVFPSSLGYGKTGFVVNGQYAVYPNTPLTFDIEIL